MIQSLYPIYHDYNPKFRTADGVDWTEVIFFKNKQAFDHFTQENFEFGAQVSAVALNAGISADLDYSGGVAIVTASIGGLRS
jgi:hypothetical protein